jgi:hypothetical protein
MRLAACAFVALALVPLALVAVGCAGDDERALREDQAFATRGSITPRVQLFGDEVVARVEVIVDRERFEPERIRVAPAFEPYEIQGEPERAVRELGDFSSVKWVFRLRCLSYGCLKLVGGGPSQHLPGGIPNPNQSGGFGERASLRLKAARVLYEKPDGGRQVLTQVGWPEMQSVSRVNFADTDVIGFGFPFEASVTPLVEASYRAPPPLLAGAFVAGGLALLGLSGLLLAGLRRREEPVAVEEVIALSPLEQALVRVEAARDGPEPERREALEALAAELDPAAHADDARRLAWSPAEPVPEAMDDLVEAVRGADAPTG